MTYLVLPERITLHAHVWDHHHARPYHGAPLVFGIRTFSRAKNDYHLGPVFTDETGLATLSRHQLELYVSATLSTGIMDFCSINDSFAFVEIVLWSAAEVNKAINARTTYWKNLLDGESELFGSMDALLARLRSAGNAQFASELSKPVRDEWDGSRTVIDYSFVLIQAAA